MLKSGLRTLFKTPFVTIVAIVSLALGIGANAAIFSLFNQMILLPLPVRNPGELVNLSAPGPKPGSQSCNDAGDCDVVFSYPMFRDLESAQTVFTGIAAHWLFGANLAARGQTLSGQGLLVSGSYFPVLGVRRPSDASSVRTTIARSASRMWPCSAMPIACTVARRTREIGLRMALGAAPARVRAMVLRQVGVMTLIGGAIGLTAAVWLGRLAQSLLYQLFRARTPRCSPAPRWH